MRWIDCAAWLVLGLVVALVVVRDRSPAARAGSGSGWTVLAGLAGGAVGGLLGRLLAGGPRRDGSANVIAILLAGFFAAAFALACRRWRPGETTSGWRVRR